MNKALKGMPNGPALPQPVGEQVEQLRHLFEHWWEAHGDFDKGSAWERLAIKHGAVYATPWSVESDGSDLKIGADRISVQEVEQVLTRVLDELLRMDTEEQEQIGS